MQASCNYTFVGPALLVLPLFLISIINLAGAGPPLKTIVLEPPTTTYSANLLPHMHFKTTPDAATFTLRPADEMTHFFVVTCIATDASQNALLDSRVEGRSASGAPSPLKKHEKKPPAAAVAAADADASADGAQALQLMQTLVGYPEYVVQIEGRTPTGAPSRLPSMEYRLTYVPSRFAYTQVGVRLFFLILSVSMLALYANAICRAGKLAERGTQWILTLLVLLVMLNDPAYILGVLVHGSETLLCISVIGQIAFSGGLFMFWLVYADGMAANMSSSAALGGDERASMGSFYLPKLVLVTTYVGVSVAIFVLHGRLPDRISVYESDGMAGGAPLPLIGALCGSLFGVGAWLTFMIARAVHNLGWKKVEYIYTEREKSFVGVTIVFVVLWLCGHVYRAVHGRRGSWMQLQMPFLTLTNSYLTLLTHAFWPGGESSDELGGRRGGSSAESGGEYDDPSKQRGLLEEED